MVSFSKQPATWKRRRNFDHHNMPNVYVSRVARCLLRLPDDEPRPLLKRLEFAPNLHVLLQRGHGACLHC